MRDVAGGLPDEATASPLVVERYDAGRHKKALVALLLELAAVDPPYPSRLSSDGTAESLESWLAAEPGAVDWVATRDGEVLGHVRVTDPHPYLVAHGPAMGVEIDAQTHGEVVKFFVSTVCRRDGVGRSLLTTAMRHIESSERRPVLAVLDGSTGAIAFYNAMGLVEIGAFDGEEGLNHVFMGSPEGA
ncbi:hypothetical protein GCM10009641_87670 [Mycobacterium cookii]|uniref:N-acetyltransferase domain-containing protein n=1 Tax=Nocardioides furvisabuli TaxID=375542 RepID=A0ABN2WVL5_9ACTN|nr:GNAT family N-acetyltransferase [Nocardioides furvisabuli]